MRVLMVCLGNICRSPMAEGILAHISELNHLDWEVDSAGTSSWHIGEAPDPRSIEEAKNNGIDISKQRSRQFVSSDFENFDLILAMDAQNYRDIISVSKNKESDKEKVKLLLDYSFPGENRRVPDPYFEGGFGHVYELIYNACKKLIKIEIDKKNKS